MIHYDHGADQGGAIPNQGSYCYEEEWQVRQQFNDYGPFGAHNQAG